MEKKGKLRELMSDLEQNHSYECCIALAQALGYGVGGEPDAVWVDKPEEPIYSLWFSLDALSEELLGDARRYIGCDD